MKIKTDREVLIIDEYWEVFDKHKHTRYGITSAIKKNNIEKKYPQKYSFEDWISTKKLLILINSKKCQRLNHLIFYPDYANEFYERYCDKNEQKTTLKNISRNII